VRTPAFAINQKQYPAQKDRAQKQFPGVENECAEAVFSSITRFSNTTKMTRRLGKSRVRN
jgi:hypothetical protein